jgi:signal transduction histidine kinase
METVKVLLVEDDEDDYLITRSLLAEIGDVAYVVDWAATYEDGVQKLSRDRYDVCLLDYRLDSRSGLDLLPETRQHLQAVPVILLTGYTDREVDLQAMQSGAVDYLPKADLDATRLERVIRYAIAIKRQEVEHLQLALAEAARVQAEEANRAKDEFLGMVSHELRAPLNAMLVWLEVLRGPNVDPVTAAQALATIERSVKQQGRILDDLLDINRIVRGTLRIEKRSIELGSVIDAAVSAVRPDAEAKAIAVDVVHNPTLGRVAVDPERMQQVVVNLLANSIKFTPAGGHIAVRLERVSDPEPRAQISVSDTGAGIDAALLPYVFDRYHQGQDLPGSSRQGGLGLGLTIVRQAGRAA